MYKIKSNQTLNRLYNKASLVLEEYKDAPQVFTDPYYYNQMRFIEDYAELNNVTLAQAKYYFEHEGREEFVKEENANIIDNFKDIINILDCKQMDYSPCDIMDIQTKKSRLIVKYALLNRVSDSKAIDDLWEKAYEVLHKHKK